MGLVIAICGLVVVFAYEIRHRMDAERFTYLENEIHRVNDEVKKLQEEVKKKQDAEEPKKGFKLPFFP